MEDSSANFVNASACSYATLSHYNKSMPGETSRPPIPAGTVSGHYIVPVWGASGYDVLTGNGVGSCSGYFSIESAYGKNAGQCNQKYTTKLCQ